MVRNSRTSGLPSVALANHRSKRNIARRKLNLASASAMVSCAEPLEQRRLLSGGLDRLVNNNTGSSGTALFTQSETTVIAFGNNVVIGFNDSGSNNGASKFTGWSYSSDGGATFTDGGTLPTNTNGDAGDPSLARDNVTGRIYYSTLQFTGAGIRVFRSDDNGVSWQAPVQGTPGKSGTQDKEWITVDNFPGAGQGNVYLVDRDFGTGNGVYFFRSTDGGATFGPNAGTAIITGTSQGAFVTVGPDHSVYAFWLGGSSIFMRKSTDFGVSFGPTTTVATGIIGGTNGDLALTGLRNGTASFSGFRSNAFPHVAVNPVSGNLYAVYNNRGAGGDKADVLLVQSTNGGASWSAPVKVNDDATTTDQWQPTLAVTPDGNSLGVFYYSRQEDTVANNQFKYYGRIASISGATLNFAASSAISDVPSLPEFGRDSVVNSVYMGDYNFATATAGMFHVVWSDNRSALPGGGVRMDPNVYYDQIPTTVTPNGIWTGLGDGTNWTDAANWSNNIVPGPADDVLIDVPANPNVVIASGAQSVHSLTSAENLNLSGGSLTLAQNSTISGRFTLSGGTLSGAGDLSLSNGSNVWTAGTMDGLGRMIVTAAANLNMVGASAKISTRPIQIDGTATAANGANEVLVFTSLTLGALATLDLNDNDLILDYSGPSQLSVIQGAINSARNGGTWTGTGLNSTAARSNALHNTTLAAMESLDFKALYGGGALFDGQTIDNSAVLVKYTYYGDTDFNGAVNFDDYVRTDSGFNNNRTGWMNGDFDGNGLINFDDYVLIDLAFNTQGAALRRSGSLPGRPGGKSSLGGRAI